MAASVSVLGASAEIMKLHGTSDSDFEKNATSAVAEHTSLIFTSCLVDPDLVFDDARKKTVE